MYIYKKIDAQFKKWRKHFKAFGYIQLCYKQYPYMYILIGFCSYFHTYIINF